MKRWGKSGLTGARAVARFSIVIAVVLAAAAGCRTTGSDRGRGAGSARGSGRGAAVQPERRVSVPDVGEFAFFACNRSVAEKYMGIKDAFSRSERMELVVHWYDYIHARHTFEVKIYYGNTSILATSMRTRDRHLVRDHVPRVGFRDELMPTLLDLGGVGQYRATFSIDGTEVDSLEFEIFKMTTE